MDSLAEESSLSGGGLIFQVKAAQVAKMTHVKTDWEVQAQGRRVFQKENKIDYPVYDIFFFGLE